MNQLFKAVDALYNIMPHALTMPPSGFQAIILCGPGASLNTFTSTPDEFPKALVPIANRPMIWYPLDWCYRMGITSKCRLANLFLSKRSMFNNRQLIFNFEDIAHCLFWVHSIELCLEIVRMIVDSGCS